MKFKSRNLRELAEMVVGDVDYFPYRSSSYITEFFEECDLDFQHDGSTRRFWAMERLEELLQEPPAAPNSLPSRFVHVLRTLMLKSDATKEGPDRSFALSALNKPLLREGYEAFYGDDDFLYIRHKKTRSLSEAINPHRPFTPKEIEKRDRLFTFLESCSEDELIEQILSPLFRQLGFQRITAAGHKDKALEYGKDIWMKFTLPTLHVLYFGLQVKKGKLSSSGISKKGSSNVAEMLNQVTMMLGHEIFDPEINRRVLVDHAIVVAGGEITKAAKNWLGGQLDAVRRSQILFMDRDDIVNLFVSSGMSVPGEEDKLDSIIEFSDLPF